MNGLAFALELSTRDGWQTSTLATFREAADLWTFYEAWRQECEPATVREARFCYRGRANRHTRPFESREATLTWAQEAAERDRGSAA